MEYMQNLRENGEKGEKETIRFILIAIVTTHCLVLTTKKMKTFQCIFLCQWFEISHATDFQKTMYGDI